MNWLLSLLGLPPHGTASAAPLTNGAGRAENRYCDRLRSGFRFKLSWKDQRGKTRRARARVVDMNGTGALVECGAAIPPGSFVFIQTTEVGLMGSAHVRRCEPLFFSYQIGLQFEAPLMARF